MSSADYTQRGTLETASTKKKGKQFIPNQWLRVLSQGPCVKGVTMYSWLVTVLLLATAASNSRGAQVPITSYTCTQPNQPGFLDQGQCTDSGGLRTCAIKGGARPTLLSSSGDRGLYGWLDNTNPFVVLDIPNGWCVGSVEMTFRAPGSTPALSLSVHSAERLSTNTDRTIFCKAIDNGDMRRPVVMMNFTALARGKYLRINMTSTERIYLREIEVFGTNDSICTHPPSAGGDPASPTTSVGSSTYSVTSTLFTPPCPASASPAMSARQTTTSVLSSSFKTTPISSQSGTSDKPTTSGPTSTPSQSPSTPSSSVPVGTDSYVLPAAISVVAVLLVTVLTAIFGVVICIITRRHKTRKSRDMQRLSSIHYLNTQSDLTFQDNQFHCSQSVDANAVVNHQNEIGEAPQNYAGRSPTKSNNSVVQGTAEEPMLGGDISRHKSQVSSKPTHGMVTWVNPSMLDHPFDSCYWENTMAGTDIGGHYETSLQWQHAGGWYNFQSDCQLNSKGAATNDRQRVLKDTKAHVGTTHQPAPQAPPSALPIAVVESVYADTLTEAPEKKREPSPISSTYASADPLSCFSMLAPAQPSKNSSPHQPSHSAKRPHVPQIDHIYSEVNKSRKKSASSTSSPPARLTHSTDTTHYSGTDADLWGGSGNVEGDTMTQPQSITSSSTAKGAVPTQELVTCVYAQVDISKKKSRRGKKKICDILYSCYN